MTRRFILLSLLATAGVVACRERPPHPVAQMAPRATGAGVSSAVRVAEKMPAEPCAHIDAHRRALPLPSLEPKLAEAASRCRTSAEGAWSLLVTASGDDVSTFVVALERVDGTLATSEPHTIGPSSLAPELVVLPRPGTPALVMAKLAGQLVPVPLGAPMPVQTRAFFADALGGGPGAEYPWVALTPEVDGYRLDFELPSLQWRDPIPHGGQRRSMLRGVRVSMLLDSSLRPRAADEPTDSVRRACASVSEVSQSPAENLWAAAQCARIRGLEASQVLARVKARCAALGIRALPLVIAAARADARARDGLPPDKAPRPSPEELAHVAPPGACFATEDRLWTVDYTARLAPFRVPRVELDAAWEHALPRLQH